jgi:predicted nucleic acid-binding protein
MRAKRILLDVNIIMDLLLARKPFAEDAKALFQRAIDGEIEIYITSCSINTLVYYIEKAIGFIETRKIISNFLQIAKGIDITMNDIQKAFANLAVTDTEDAIQMQGAIKADMDLILTRDASFLKSEGQKVAIMSMEAYLRM